MRDMSAPHPEWTRPPLLASADGARLDAAAMFCDRKPDTGLLGGGQSPAPKFPFGSFGNFGSLIQSIARSQSAPPDYVAFAMLTCAAALMGNARSVKPDPDKSPDWDEPLALWTCLVGPPSSGKTPAMRPFTGLLTKIEADDAIAFGPVMAAYEAKREAAKLKLAQWKSDVSAALANGGEPPPKPADAVIPPRALAPRTYTTNATIEALIALLHSNPNGVLMMRDELAGWIGDMTRYSNSSDRPLWLQMYNGDPITVDRIKNDGEPLHVDNALVSVLGGMQPGRLLEVLKGADDGLVARMMFICPDAAPLMRPDGRPDMASLTVAFNHLRGLKGSAVTMSFTPDAADYFYTHLRHHTRKLELETGGKLQSWIGKGNGLVARLAAILTLLDWAFSGQGVAPHTVQVGAVERACSLWAEYLLPMARRAFGDAARPAVEQRAVVLLKAIRKHCTASNPVVNERVIRRDWKLDDLREPKPLRETLSYLHDAGWTFMKVSDAEYKAGRPRGDWWINPKLWPE
jgi:hypothetical protein